MTIFINATSARMGGALTYLHNLVRELDNNPHGHSISIAAREKILGFAPARIKILKVPARVCDSPFRIFWWQQITLPRILHSQKIDLLYSTANFATFFCPCPQILLVRIPLYFSTLYKRHILPKKFLLHRLAFFFRAVFIRSSQKTASHTFFPTAALRRDFFAPLPVDQKKTSVNWYGTTIQFFAKKNTLQTSPIRLLCTSHYSDYKNYTSLLEALWRLKNEASFQFLLTATIDPSLPLFKTLPSAKYDLALIRRLGDTLEALGPLSRARTTALYSNADIFLWPSLAESFGHPLIEAMVSGLPIICSDIPVNREICGDAAMYVPPLDSNAWADTLLKLSRDESLRAQLIYEGRARASLFQWKDHVERLCTLFSHYDQNQHTDTSV